MDSKTTAGSAIHHDSLELGVVGSFLHAVLVTPRIPKRERVIRPGLDDNRRKALLHQLEDTLKRRCQIERDPQVHWPLVDPITHAVQASGLVLGVTINARGRQVHLAERFDVDVERHAASAT